MKTKKRSFFNIARRVPRVLAVFLVFFAFMSVFLAIESSNYGAQLLSLEREKTAIESQNQELRSTLVASTSLAEIAERAEEMGMVKPESLAYIGKSLPTGLVNREKPVARVP